MDQAKVSTIQRNGERRLQRRAVVPIEFVETALMPEPTQREVRDLCREAYEEDCSQYFTDIGAGTHALLRAEGTLVSHAIVVQRMLALQGEQPLSTAYVELVATRPSHQGRGYATELLRGLVSLISQVELGALSPSDAGFYERIGWEVWRGPLAARTSAGLEQTPGEVVMVLRVPRTPANLDLDAPLSVEWRPGEVW